MENMNGRVGNDDQNIQRYMGKNGEHAKNDCGVIIIDLCRAISSVITNTKSTHKNIHKFTREMHSRKENSIIDCFLVIRDSWKLIKDVKVKRHAEIGSDHHLVQTEVTIHAEKSYQVKGKAITKEKIKRYKLKEEEISSIFQEKLRTSLKTEEINGIVGTENKWKYFKENILTAAKASCGITKVSHLRTMKSK